ncbi:MAG: hypothetical protein ABI413_02280 [Ktedonobacteraceae bacterium]
MAMNNGKTESAAGGDVAGGQKIVQILEAIKAATEASACEMKAIRQLLEKNAASPNQGQETRSAQRWLDKGEQPEGTKAYNVKEGEDIRQEMRTSTSYDAYRTAQRAQSPCAIRLVSRVE